MCLSSACSPSSLITMRGGCTCSLADALTALFRKRRDDVDLPSIAELSEREKATGGAPANPRSGMYQSAQLQPISAPQATAGTGFVSSSVFGVQAEVDEVDAPVHQEIVQFHMVTVNAKQMEALASSTGLLMLSPFLPESLKGCRWRMSEFSTWTLLYSTNLSQVFHVTHKASKTHLAVKCYNKDAMREDQKIQAVREIWFHSRLSHPNIIAMHAAWSEAGKICMALEYATGGSTFRRLRRIGRYDEDACASTVILQTLCALEFLHGLGLIHRDIKPENILLTGDGAKLADLGLVINHRDEPANSCLGTFDYMAPELFELPRKAFPMQFKADPGAVACDSKLDVWAVGVLAYEMLLGRAPFSGKTSAATVQQIRRGFTGRFPDTAPPQLSAPAKDFIQRCLRHAPAARPTIEQLLRHHWIRGHCWEAAATARRAGELSQELVTGSEPAWSDLLEEVDAVAAHRVKTLRR
eukprot:jgi/Ulvmu1/1103/UM106_0020.1